MTFRNWEDSVKKQMNETSYNIKGDKKMKLTKIILHHKKALEMKEQREDFLIEKSGFFKNTGHKFCSFVLKK